MPNLSLTWSEPNRCWVKIVGAWFNAQGKRVPRFFRFKKPNTPEGLKTAQDELMSVVVEWRRIKAAAKVAGDKKPVWHRKSLESVRMPGPFELATPARPEEDADEHEVARVAELTARREQLLNLATALRANTAANPVKPLDKASVGEAVEAYAEFYRMSGNKPRSIENHLRSLDAALKSLDRQQKMMHVTDIEVLVQHHLDRMTAQEVAPRTAFNYCKLLKALFEWYAHKVKEYDLPKDFKKLFLKRRFKRAQEQAKVFTKDGEERDFEIYTSADVKVLFECCNTHRQRLYVLLALQAGMYYEDIARALLTENVHLDEKRPFLMYQRTKEEHHQPITQVVWLWPETAWLLRREMNTKKGIPYALLSEDGKPMTWHGPAQTWDRVQRRAKKLLMHRLSVKFKDLRKTGGSAVANHSSVDLGELHLGHKIPTMGSAYIKLAKDRLYEPLMAWHAELAAAGVLESLPKPRGRNCNPRAAAKKVKVKRILLPDPAPDPYRQTSSHRGM